MGVQELPSTFVVEKKNINVWGNVLKNVKREMCKWRRIAQSERKKEESVGISELSNKEREREGGIGREWSEKV